MRLQNKSEVAGVISLLCVMNFLFYNIEKWLKSVYIDGSYHKIKTEAPLFGPLCIDSKTVCRVFVDALAYVRFTLLFNAGMHSTVQVMYVFSE